MALPTKEFPDFHGKKTSWKEFENKVEDLELQKYIPLVYLVNSLEERTMEALNIFKEKVMIKRYKQNEADIIITTCHAAKGMEWDFVQVCPDFLETTHFQRSCNSIPVSQTTSFLEDEPPMKRQRPDSDNASNTREKWEFKVSSFDDEVNLLYVACTRAKKILSLPKNFVNLFDVLDTYHEWCSPIYRDRNRKLSSKVTEEKYVSRNNNDANEFSLEHKEEIYQDICLPLRKELNVNDNQHLQSFLVDYKREEPDDKESNFIEDTVKDESDSKPEKTTSMAAVGSNTVRHYFRKNGMKSHPPSKNQAFAISRNDSAPEEKDLESLMSMGFERSDAMRCLKDTNVDIELAVSMLCSK